MTQRGIALVEVVVAATLTGFVALLAGGTVLRAGTELQRRSERFASEQALRSLTASLRVLLQSSASGSEDLAAVGSSGLATRVVRGIGVLCEADSMSLVLRRGAGYWQATRAPVPGRDSLLIGRLTEPGWIALELRANPVGRTCPDGTPGTALPMVVTPADLAVLGSGSPVRIFEPVELRSYLSSGSGWIGLRAIATGETVQPLAGPLPAGGLWLGWLNWSGGTASTPEAASAVQFRATALTTRDIPDSIAGFIALKGNFR